MAELDRDAASGEDVALVLVGLVARPQSPVGAAAAGARPPPPGPAWADHRARRLGRRPRPASVDPQRDGAAGDRLLRDPPVAVARTSSSTSPSRPSCSSGRTRRRISSNTVHIIGESWTGRAYELRQVLGRCAVPHDVPPRRFAGAGARHVGRRDECDAAARGLPERHRPRGSDQPRAGARRRRLRSIPRTASSTSSSSAAGPAGLSAAVYGASEGLRTLVVDNGGIGGQATSSSLIRNYLGFPRGVSGRRLAESAYEQAWVFGAKFAFMHDATVDPARRRPAPRRTLRRRRGRRSRRDPRDAAPPTAGSTSTRSRS